MLQERLIWSCNIRSHYEKQYKMVEPGINMKCVTQNRMGRMWCGYRVLCDTLMHIYASVMWNTYTHTYKHRQTDEWTHTQTHTGTCNTNCTSLCFEFLNVAHLLLCAMCQSPLWNRYRTYNPNNWFCKQNLFIFVFLIVLVPFYLFIFKSRALVKNPLFSIWLLIGYKFRPTHQ